MVGCNPDAHRAGALGVLKQAQTHSISCAHRRLGVWRCQQTLTLRDAVLVPELMPQAAMLLAGDWLAPGRAVTRSEKLPVG